jgi:hypothetical protein
MKILLKIGSFAVCAVALAASLSGCKSDAAIKIKSDQIDIRTSAGNSTGAVLTGVGSNKVADENDIVRVDAAANVNDVEYDLTKFFSANPKFLGKKFYFTRDDVKKGDGTLVRGTAWVETEPGNASTRKYKKLGMETKSEIKGKTKQQISDMPDREGSVRLYCINNGTPNTKYVIYGDPALSSNIESGETRVTFKLHGHNGKTAKLQTKIVKK